MKLTNKPLLSIKVVSAVFAFMLVIACDDAEFSGDNKTGSSGSKNGSGHDIDAQGQGGPNGTGNGGSGMYGPGGTGNGSGGPGIGGGAGGNGPLGSIGGMGGYSELCANVAKQQTKRENLTFPRTIGGGCAIGRSGSETFNAATQQKASFTIPQNAYLCSLDLNGTSPNFTYDDTLFLTINDLVLGTSSFNESNFGSPVAGSTLYALDIQNIISRRVNRYGGGTGYCAPGSTCTIPQSEANGLFDFKVGQNFMTKLPAVELANKKFDIGLTIGGNGEQGSGNFDCQHSGVNLTADVKYVIP